MTQLTPATFTSNNISLVSILGWANLGVQANVSKTTASPDQMASIEALK